MSRRLPFALAALLSLPLSARAAVDPEVGKKYQVQIVLSSGTHNWLGDQFRTDLRSDLAGILTDALGGMADVTVVDLKKTPAAQWPPLWRDVEARGFAALDTPQPVTGVKTHFLRIDYVNGQYELQTRQSDGLTGLPGAARADRTADRALVTRLAGRMIADDFGVVGTLEGINLAAKSATVRFKGAGLNPAFERWARKGDVFAVVAVSGQGDRASRVPDTLVQLTDDPKGGAAPAMVEQRAQKGTNPLANPAAAGFRCIKLSAVIGPVRVRLVDERGQPHNRPLQVWLYGNSGQKPDPADEVLSPDRQGQYQSKKPFENYAFIRVVSGNSAIAQLPVPVLEDRVVTVAVAVDAQKEALGQWQYEVNELYRSLVESRDVVNTGWEGLNRLVTQTKFDDALKQAKASRATLEDDLTRLQSQLEALKKDPAATPAALGNCNKMVTNLEKYRTVLNVKIGELEEVIRQENDPNRVASKKRLHDLDARSKAQIENSQYEEAIATCKEILKEFGDQPVVKKRLDDLERGWALKGDDHRAAREFVYREWATVKNSADLEAKLPTARQKLQVLVKVDDQFTLRKLSNSMVTIDKALADEIKAANENPEDEKIAKLKKVAEDYEKFGKEVDAALKN